MLYLTNEKSAYHRQTKLQKSIENPCPSGRSGGSSSRIFANISKSLRQFLYGNSPVASSTWQHSIQTQINHDSNSFHCNCNYWTSILIRLILSSSLVTGLVPMGIRCLLRHLLPAALVQCWVAHFLQTCSAPLHNILYPLFAWALSVSIPIHHCVFNFLSSHTQHKSCK